MPADHCVWLEDAQPVPPGRPATGHPNPQQAVRLPKAETTRRALLQDGDLMAEGNDLRLLSGTGPKCRADQSQKSDEKWSHCGNDDDLTNGARTCIFNPDGVFGIHRTNYYAIDNTCTHRGGPLAEGMLVGEEVICPWHGAHFNVKTGAVCAPPAREGVKSFPVRIVGTDVEVEIE